MAKLQSRLGPYPPRPARTALKENRIRRTRRLVFILSVRGPEPEGQVSDVFCVLAGGGVLGDCVPGLRHDLAAQVGSGDLQGVAPVLEDVPRLVHQGLQLVLHPESVF